MIQKNSFGGDKTPLNNKMAAFTLVELMVTLVLMGVIAAFAFPSFSNMIQNNQSQSASSSLLSALNFARSEAVTRSSTVVAIPNNSGWANGFTIGVDSNGDGDLSDSGDELLRNIEALDGVTSSGNIAKIEFSAQGENAANLNQTITLTPKKCSGTEKREITIGLTGLVKIEKKEC